MACEKMKECLSDFIDGTLDAQTKASVEAHLSNCKSCREETALLRALIQALKSLKPIDAPADFLEQLHDRMASRSIFTKMVKKLFVPFRIKVPLALVTAGTMAILIFTLVNIQQKERKPSQIPPRTESSIASKKSPVEYGAKETLEKEVDKMPSDFDTTLAPEPARQQAPIELSLLIKNEKSEAQHTLGTARETAPAFEKKEERTRAGMRAAPGENAEALKLSNDKRPVRPAITEDGALKEEAGMAGSRLAGTLSKVRDLISLVEGNVVSVDPDGPADRSQTIHAEIPAANYEKFVVRLRNVAELQSPPPTLSVESGEVIKIRIRLLIAD